MQNEDGFIFSSFNPVMNVGTEFAVWQVDLHKWFKCLKYVLSIHYKRMFLDCVDLVWNTATFYDNGQPCPGHID